VIAFLKSHLIYAITFIKKVKKNRDQENDFSQIWLEFSFGITYGLTIERSMHVPRDIMPTPSRRLYLLVKKGATTKQCVNRAVEIYVCSHAVIES